MKQNRIRVLAVNLARGYGGVERVHEAYAAYLDRERYEHFYACTPFPGDAAHVEFMRRTVDRFLPLAGLFSAANAGFPSVSRAAPPARRSLAVSLWKRWMSARVDEVVHHVRRSLTLRRKMAAALAPVTSAPQLCHIHAAQYDTMWASVAVCRRLFPEAGLLVQLHNAPVFFRPTGFERRSLRLAGVCAYNSAYVQDAWRAVGARPRREVILPNPVRMGAGPADRGGRETGTLRFATVGRLSPIKGVAVAIQALGLLQARSLNAELWIVGDGPERERLRVLAENSVAHAHIRFLGFQQDPDCLWPNIDVFLQPTTGVEALGMSVIEAMASGACVIASRTGGLPELITDGETGLLVEPGDVTGLTSAMARLAGNALLRAQMGKAASAFVRARYEAGRATTLLEMVYVGLCNK